MKFKKYCPSKLRSKAGSNAGFTLVELLVATSITTVALSLAGIGLVAIMQYQQKTAIEVAQRTNLNRALEFIADEVRMSKMVSTPTTNELPNVSCGTVTGVLKLNLPLDSSTVIYYIHNLSGCSNTIWLKPTAIYRCTFNAASSRCSTVGDVVVDAVMPMSASPSCSNSDTSGFYATISNDRSVELCLRGQMINAYGNSFTSPYFVRSKIAARSF